MKTHGIVGIVIALAANGGPALAQAPGAGLPPGAPGGFRGLAEGGPTVGIVRQIDRARNAVQVQTLGPAAELSRWVTVSPETAIFIQRSGTLAELKPNDTIVVSGVPTAITAAQIQIGELPPPGAMPGAFGGGQGLPAPPLPGSPPAPPPGAVPPPVPEAGAQPVPSDLPPRPAGAPGGAPGFAPGGPVPVPLPFARVMGAVVTTQPLVLRLLDGLQVTVTAGPATRVSKLTRATLADLKVGDTLRAFGQPDANGNLAATRVEAGIDLTPALGGVVPLQPARPGTF